MWILIASITCINNKTLTIYKLVDILVGYCFNKFTSTKNKIIVNGLFKIFEYHPNNPFLNNAYISFWICNILLFSFTGQINFNF